MEVERESEAEMETEREKETETKGSKKKWWKKRWREKMTSETGHEDLFPFCSGFHLEYGDENISPLIPLLSPYFLISAPVSSWCWAHCLAGVLRLSSNTILCIACDETVQFWTVVNAWYCQKCVPRAWALILYRRPGKYTNTKKIPQPCSTSSLLCSSFCFRVSCLMRGYDGGLNKL